MPSKTTSKTSLLFPRAALAAAVVAASLSATGCNDKEPAPTVPPPATSAPTYWGDVAPIFYNKCVACHQEGGVGPFRLDRYEDARDHGLQAAVATQAGIMPPYLVSHDGSCGQFEDAETLTAAEKATIWQWANGGMKPGAVAIPAGGLPRKSGATLADAREYRTPTIAPVADGGELAEFDEYRCFALDSGLERDTFITGYEVVPGTPALVHHLVAFLVDPNAEADMGDKSNAQVMAELDAADPDRPGWSCFSGAGEGVSIQGAPAVWAPGQGVIRYPGGVGVPLRREHKLVVQMHYNLAGHGGAHPVPPVAPGTTDSTTLRLIQADQVARQGLFVVNDGLLNTLFDGQEPASLAPGQSSVKYTWSMTGKEMGMGDRLPYVDIVGVMPHMHERGRRKQMRIGPDGGQLACAAQVDRWDFNWQKFYFYKDPIRFDATTRVELTCDYDTSRDGSAIMPGWGTRNEMCTAILLVALPPGM
jgi:hypothetical protein